MSEGPESLPADERTLRMEAQLAAVTARVFQLEQEVAALRGESKPGIAAELPDAATTSASSASRWEVPEPAFRSHDIPGTPAPHVEPTATMPATTVPAATLPPRLREERSLENRVGSQWFNRIGIIAVLIGVAWFLKFAFDNHWVGPAGRVLIGLLSGAALIAWSERFRNKGYPAFSYSLKAVGSGVLYLSLWAAFSMYHLIPPGVAFAGMVLVTAFNAFIAWRQSAELLAVYAIVGAFSTPLLLSTGNNEEVFLFSYLLMMNAATMALLLSKGWNRLLVLSFLGTVAFYWGWYWQFYGPPSFTTTALFLALFVLLFAAATILARQRRVHAEQDDVARVLVSLANAAFGFLGYYAMLSQNGSGRNTALAWCSVGFGAFYLGVRKLMERTPVAGTRLASLADIQLSIAIVFLTLAVPLAVHGNWVTVGWMTEGAVLVWVATRMRTALMRTLAAGALTLGLISLAMDSTIAQTRIFWNTRLLSFVVSIAAVAVATVLARGEARRESATAAAAAWKLMTLTGTMITHALVIVAVMLEIHTYWWSSPAPVPGTPDLRTPGSVLSSAIWLMVASGAIVWTAARRSTIDQQTDQQAAAHRVEAACWFATGLAVLFTGMFYSQQQVIWNLRFVAFLVAIASVVWAGRQLRVDNTRAGSRLRLIANVLGTVLALTAVCFEIATFWSTRSLDAAPGSMLYGAQLAERQMAERFSYSAWFLFAGAALLAVGFRRRSALLRWQGLVLLAITICKVFLLDTSTLSQGYRIISFLALGALLLAVSFAYQRDWLHLRAAATANGGDAN